MTNAHHQVIDLDSLSLEVLTLADGRRTRAAMVDALMESLRAGRLEIGAGEVVEAGEVGGSGDGADEAGGKPVAEQEARAALADRLEGVLSTLARSALLVE